MIKSNDPIHPSCILPKWFQEFRHRYRRELVQKHELLTTLRSLAEKGPLTLDYSAHDVQHNQAVVLREALLH